MRTNSPGTTQTTIAPYRRSRHRARRLACGTALSIAALAFPAAALAHTGTADVSCTGADLAYTAFAAGANTVSYRVTSDGATVAEGTTTLTANGGREGTLHVPLSLSGAHSVEAFEWWGPADVQDGNTRSAAAPALASKVLDCPVAPPGTPPVTTPPVTTPPIAAPTGSTPAPVPVASGPFIAGARAASGRARLTVQRACVSRTAQLTITGRFIRRVTITVDGRHARTVAVRTGARSIRIPVPLRRSGAARQTVRVSVTFRNGAPARSLTARATRCARTTVSPKFTG
jgi:hypothetical protein